MALERIEKLKVGTVYDGFSLKKVKTVPELNLCVADFEHAKSGARYIHIAADDVNNAFSVSFKNPALDDTGVTHIIEHMVLCGSEKYPVKDPFFKMITRSVNTFMNAFTYPDHTTYPFSSPNKQDFFNLLSIYLDCVFNPILSKRDFLQEAWRIEMKEGKPSIQGVVLNEMKGVINSANEVTSNYFIKTILGNSYPYESGGDPLKIVDLTYDQLINYHKKFYHPSNSLFLTYGDTHVEEYLQHLGTFLSPYSSRGEMQMKDLLYTAEEKSLSEAIKAHVLVPIDPLVSAEKQGSVSVGYRLPKGNYFKDRLIWQILSELLLTGPRGPFHKSLLQSGLGSSYCANTGFSGYYNSPLFGVGLKNIREKDSDKVLEIIGKTLSEVAETGFQDSHVEGIIREIELSLKHVKANSGISYISKLPISWTHFQDPVDAFCIQETLDFVRKEHKNGLFTKLVKEQLLNNKDSLRLTAAPDDKFMDKIREKEDVFLSELLAKDHKFALAQEALEETVDADKILPKIVVDDLPKLFKGFQAEHGTSENAVPIQYTIQPTNGVTYICMLADTSSVPLLYAPYLPLFCHIITNIGTKDTTHEEMSDKISLASSGFTAGASCFTDINDTDQFEQGVLFKSYCLNNNLSDMLALWVELFSYPRIVDDEHVKSLINDYIDENTTDLSDMSSSLAMVRARSHKNKPSQHTETIQGVSQVEFLRNLADVIDERDSVAFIIENLNKVATFVLDQSKMRCFVVTDETYEAEILDIIGNFVSELPSNTTEITADGDSSKLLNSEMCHKEFIYMPFRVNYNAKCYRAVNYTHEDYPKLKVLKTVLSSKFLLTELREKGGAYGAGANIDDGCFTFYTYRDPNFARTFETFDKSLEWIKNKSFTSTDLEEAKVRLLGNMDKPVQPSKRSFGLFCRGITNEMLQKERETILSCTEDDLVTMVDRYFISDGEKPVLTSSVCIGESLEEAEHDKSWVINRKYTKK